MKYFNKIVIIQKDYFLLDLLEEKTNVGYPLLKSLTDNIDTPFTIGTVLFNNHMMWR